jgi:F-type H+-transporting ATPase subunit b
MFDWWTFFFQTVNFFVVLYILYRLFFNPLRRVIQQREETIGQRLRELEEEEKRVGQDEARYREKMQEIQSLGEKELEEAREKALIEKDLLMKEASKEMARAFEKQSGILAQEQQKSEKEIRKKSLAFSLRYTEKLLRSLSDEQLHLKRVDAFLEALPQSEAEEIMLLKEEFAGGACEVTLYTPFMPQKSTQKKIEETVGRLLQCSTVALQSVEDTSLIAGVRLAVKNKIFDASLKGELQRFKEQMESEL